MADDDGNNENGEEEGTNPTPEDEGSGWRRCRGIPDDRSADRGRTPRSYLTYAMSVIVSRALPDVRDGLEAEPATDPGRDERPESWPGQQAGQMRKDLR